MLTVIVSWLTSKLWIYFNEIYKIGVKINYEMKLGRLKLLLIIKRCKYVVMSKTCGQRTTKKILKKLSISSLM